MRARLISQDPANNTRLLSKEHTFETHWQVINIGTNGWDENSADYRYFSGDKS